MTTAHRRRGARAAFALTLIAAYGPLAGAAAAPWTHTLRTMGTYASVTVVASDSAAAGTAARAAHRALQRVDALMSNWTETSEVARLNRVAADSATTVEPEVARVLAAALAVHRESHGAFDITVEPLVRAWGFIGGPPRVPDSATVRRAFATVGAHHLRFDSDARTLRFARPGVRMDLGGIAKGHGVDAARESLAAHGVRDALVDLSGNMFAMGRPADARAWRIGIRDPRDRMPYFARLEITDRAIATSGTYEQFVAAGGRTYGHILDPRTGAPAEGLIAVTVVANDAMTADAWGTALFVLGPGAALRAAGERDDLEAVLVVPGGAVDTVYVERSLEDRFTLEPGARGRFHVVWF
jgi:thiamine biosynthesis lipoprotein